MIIFPFWIIVTNCKNDLNLSNTFSEIKFIADFLLKELGKINRNEI